MNFNLKKLLKNSTIIFGGSVINTLLNLLVGILIARKLGPSSYGFLGVVIAVSTTTKAFLSARTEEALTKFLVIYRTEGGGQVYTLIVINIILEILTSFLVILLILLFLPVISEISSNSSAKSEVYVLYSFVILFSSLDSIWSCLVRDEENYKLLVMRQFLINIFQLISFFLISYSYQLDIYVVCYLYLIVSLIKFIYCGIYIYRYLKNMLTIKLELLSFSSPYLSEFWRFTRSLFFASSFSSVAKNADVIVLSLFKGDDAAGFYRLAKNLAGMLQMYSSALATTTYRDFSNILNKKNTSLILSEAKKISLIIATTVLPFSLLIIFFSNTLIVSIYGASYIDSVLPFKIILLGNSLAIIYFWAQPMMLTIGSHKFYKSSTIIISIFYIFSNALLSFNYGPSGAAFSYVLGIHLLNGSFLIFILKKIGHQYRQ